MFVRSWSGAFTALLLCAHATASPSIQQRAPEPATSTTCDTGYTLCNPSGTNSGASVPTVGAALGKLFSDLVNSLGPDDHVKRSSVQDFEAVARFLEGRDVPVQPICCAQSTKCLLIKNEGLPFCYDKFTTNYFLPDSSYGTLSNGAYHAADGTNLNLLTGAYTLSNSTAGNIYAGSGAGSKPNTASLSVPAQFTGTGVGSAIPATALGNSALIITKTSLVTSTVSGHQTVYTVTSTETQSATATKTASKNAAMPMVTPDLSNSYTGLLLGVAAGILVL